MEINENTFNAIMLNALQTYQREDWLIEATDISEATGTPVSEIIEGMFSPFCDRLVKAATFERTPENDTKARAVFFSKFTDIATRT